jgi:hypothetical protein
MAKHDAPQFPPPPPGVSIPVDAREYLLMLAERAGFACAEEVVKRSLPQFREIARVEAKVEAIG